MSEWDPTEGGHRQAFNVKTWSCPGCRLSQESYASATKDNPDLRGIKVRMEPTRFHPYLGSNQQATRHKGKSGR